MDRQILFISNFKHNDVFLEVPIGIFEVGPIFKAALVNEASSQEK